jgi:polyisoprenoid-binding protein YceI
MGLSINGKINRKDFGLTWNASLKLVVYWLRGNKTNG